MKRKEYYSVSFGTFTAIGIFTAIMILGIMLTTVLEITFKVKKRPHEIMEIFQLAPATPWIVQGDSVWGFEVNHSPLFQQYNPKIDRDGLSALIGPKLGLDQMWYRYLYYANDLLVLED